LSFFDDEVDEPRRAPRSRPRRARPSGRGRPPGDQQSIQTRRTIAAVAVVVVVVLMALLIHSCQVSARNSSLRDYNNGVSSLIDSSDATGQSVFKDLGSGAGASTLYSDFVQLLANARRDLRRAEALSVPSEMSAAQQNVVLAVRMRADGIKVLANEIEPALGTTPRDPISQIAVAMARFYASDVVYKGYAVPAIAGALNAAHLGVGGSTGNTINPGQFLTDLGWLQTGFIATKLGAHVSGGSGKNSAAPGLHGHSLNSVSVGSVTLSPSATNTIPASPAPTFQLSVTNGGSFNQFNVGCKVTIAALGDTGTSSITETTPGQTTSCSVTLPTAPTPGTYQVTASVAAVPGETNKANNSKTYTVAFQ
jgi:hypothetical protein